MMNKSQELGEKSMIIASIAVGALLGLAWGSLFSSKCKSCCETSLQSTTSKTSAWFLASTSIIRYLLLAALLTVLMVKYHLLIAWWLMGFMAGFWILLIQRTCREKSENSNI